MKTVMEHAEIIQHMLQYGSDEKLMETAQTLEKLLS